ncbi:efflux RND transporter permease subunit [Elusimicrobiota bacterium]
MLNKFISFFVNRHLLTNLMFIVIFVGGIFAWGHTKKEEMPDITFDFMRIGAVYPGATAEEVEHFVTKPIEEEVRGIDGVYRVTSTSSDGSASVMVELEQYYPNREEAITEIKNAVLDVKLPDDIINDPTFRVFKTTKKAIIDIALYDTEVHLLDTQSRKKLQQYVYALENQLLNLPQINSVNRSGYLKEEIQIKVLPENLRKFNIPFNTVMREVKNNHVRQPAGSIETKNEPKVTLLSELDTVDKLNSVVVQGGFEGQVVRLEQIAKVTKGYEKNKRITKINGHEGVILNVVKNTSSGILEAIEVVEKTVKSFNKNSLKGTSITLITLDDESLDVRNRLSLITINGSIGFTLILIMLFLFLNIRSAIWVAIGIPFTFCFAMICAFLMGYTINNITLAAVILVMGIIVDDAIVVAENIARMRSQGMSSHDASVKGTGRMFMPIVASIVTTCVAFVPLFFFSGRFGQMASFIPPIIFFMLGASLFESLVILPGHMHFEITPLKNYLSKFKKNANNAIHWFNNFEDKYEKALSKLLPYKWFVFGFFAFLLILAGFIMTKQMKFVMFPGEETRQIHLTGEADPDKDRYETAALTKKVEDIIGANLGKEVIGFRTSIARSRRGGAVEENKFSMRIEILPREKREKSAQQLNKEWNEKLKSITDLKNLKLSTSHWGQSSGSAIELVVKENNDDTRHKVAQRIESIMKEFYALKDVEIERALLNPEYKISLKREKIKRLVISPASVASTLRAALEGTVIYELPHGDEEVNVRFSIVDGSKDDIDKILDLPVENQGDYLVPLRDIVTVEKTVTPNSISRKDNKRITKIFADIKKDSRATPLEIAEHFENEVFPIILSEYPSTTLTFEGEIQDTRESKGDLINAVIMVVFLIYVILVLLFNSLFKPIIIMFIIPFGMVGIVLAFWLHGKVLFGFFAAIGALGLAGVVINDSIIMLDKLDKEFDGSQGTENTNKQIAAIARTRLRAVVLTTLTTVAGVLPTAYGLAGYDAMLAEMMLALAWGLVFGTLITLILVPCAYSFTRDINLYKVDLTKNGEEKPEGQNA